MVREWAPSNRRGFMLLAALAVVSAILAGAQYGLTGDVRWIIGGVAVVASLFHDGAGEYLAVRHPSEPSAPHGSRSHARLGAARMRRPPSAPGLVACLPGPWSRRHERRTDARERLDPVEELSFRIDGHQGVRRAP